MMPMCGAHRPTPGAQMTCAPVSFPGACRTPSPNRAMRQTVSGERVQIPLPHRPRGAGRRVAKRLPRIPRGCRDRTRPRAAPNQAKAFYLPRGGRHGRSGERLCERGDTARAAHLSRRERFLKPCQGFCVSRRAALSTHYQQSYTQGNGSQWWYVVRGSGSVGLGARVTLWGGSCQQVIYLVMHRRTAGSPLRMGLVRRAAVGSLALYAQMGAARS